jgi:hypothetical protein
MATNLYVGRRATLAAPADDATAAMQDALDALKANDTKKAAEILAAAIQGTYDGELPSPDEMQGEGIPAALATEIGEQAQTNPALARNSLKHARARLGINSHAYLPNEARARAARGPGSPFLPDERRVKGESNPWLPHGGRKPAA